MSGTDVAQGKRDATQGHQRRRAVGRRLRTAAPPTRPATVGEGHGNLAGQVLSLLSLAPVCVLTGWVVASFPLAALGVFQPLVVVPVAVLGAAILLWLGLALVRRPEVNFRAPWWSVAAVAAIAAGFAVFAATTHSEHIIPRRDAGSYIQIGYWLAHHQGLTYQVPAGAFGPSPGSLGFDSPAFYEHGSALVPQFMTGWPMLLAAAQWAGGWGGMLVLPAAVGGCAVLAVAGLAARLIGPRWAPLAALGVAAAWPVLRVAQSTYSEPLALLALAGGVCLLVDLVIAVRRDAAGDGELVRDRRGRLQRHAFAAGLVLAAGELIRLDFGIDFALALPVIGGLWLVRREAVRSFLAGSVIGGGLGLLDAVFVTRPYVEVNWSSVRLMLVAITALAVLTVLGVAAFRRYGQRIARSRWWRAVPVLGGGAVLVAGIALLVRPYVEVDHSTTDRGVMVFTETVQRQLGLPLDGTRGYAEQSLAWVSWYLGWPLLAAALIGAVLLTVRVLRGRDLRWAVVLLVYLGSSIHTLLRPGITPDHPWADRRLVVEVLPGTILFATWTVAVVNRWLTGVFGWLRLRYANGRTPGARAGAAGLLALPWAATAVVAAVLLAPVAAATEPLSANRTEQGELAATADACRALHPDDSVVFIDTLWMPTIRSQCGLPAAHLLAPSGAALDQVVASIRSAGRTPVIGSTSSDDLTALGLAPRKIVDLHTQQDQQQLVQRPDGTKPLIVQLWFARP